MTKNKMLCMWGINGAMLFSIILVVYFIFRVCHVSHSALIIPSSIVILLLLKFAAYRQYGEESALSLIIKIEGSFIVTAALITLIVAQFYDCSGDGRAYHQGGIIQYVNGYNPIYEHLDDTVYGIDTWIEHYPRACESVYAAMYSFTGSIETGKMFNTLMMVSVFVLCLGFCLQSKRFPKWMCVAISIAAVFNSVCIAQLLTTYIDGILVSFLVFLTVSIIMRETDKNMIWDCAVAAGIVSLANLKFTAVVYLTIVLGTYAIYKMATSHRREVIKSGLFMGTVYVFSILGIGFSPYVTNTIRNGHPFYPVYGGQRIEILMNQYPKDFQSKSKPEQFFMSFFSYTDNNMGMSDNKVELKIPFTFRLKELNRWSDHDTRQAGFGPLFSGVFLVSLMIFIAGKIIQITNKASGCLLGIKAMYKDKAILTIDVILAACLITVLNPACITARFIPQLWLVPVLMVLSIYLGSQHKTWIPLFTLIVYAISIIAYIPISIIKNIYISCWIKEQVQLIQKIGDVPDIKFDIYVGDAQRLRDAGVVFRQLKKDEQSTRRYVNYYFKDNKVYHDNKAIYLAFVKLERNPTYRDIINYYGHKD